MLWVLLPKIKKMVGRVDERVESVEQQVKNIGQKVEDVDGKLGSIEQKVENVEIPFTVKERSSDSYYWTIYKDWYIKVDDEGVKIYDRNFNLLYTFAKSDVGSICEYGNLKRVEICGNKMFVACYYDQWKRYFYALFNLDTGEKEWSDEENV